MSTEFENYGTRITYYCPTNEQQRFYRGFRYENFQFCPKLFYIQKLSERPACLLCVRHENSDEIFDVQFPLI